MTQQAVDLQIGGMTCASCAARIEKKLNRMPGVQASVNYATEKAHVVLPEGTAVDAAIATVEATGYTATLPIPPQVSGRSGAAGICRGSRGGIAAPPAGHLHGADRSGTGAGDDRPVAVRQLAVAEPDPRRAGRGVGGVAVPPRGLDEPAARRRDHGHADQRRCPRGVRLVAVRAVLRRRRDARHADDVPAAPRAGLRRGRDLPGGRGRGHRVHPGRPVLRGPREEAVRCRAAGTDGHGRERRCGAAGWPRAAGPGRPTPGGGPVRGPAGGEDRHRRRGHRRGVRGGRQPAHRRTRARRGRPRRRRHRRHRERRRPAGRPGHPDRRRHPTCADGPTGRGGAVRESTGTAARRPGVRGFRADRDRAGRRHSRLLAGRRGGCRGRVHRRRRGADHRLPLRPRAGHPDRVAGRHRPRRATGHPDQGPADPGIHPPGRHHRAGQDRDRHHRPDEAGRRHPGHRDRRRRTVAAGRRAGGRLRAPGRRGRRRRRPGTHRRAAGGGVVRLHPGPGCARGGGRSRRRRRPGVLAGRRVGTTPGRRARTGAAGRRIGRPDGHRRRLGRRRPGSAHRRGHA